MTQITQNLRQSLRRAFFGTALLLLLGCNTPLAESPSNPSPSEMPALTLSLDSRREPGLASPEPIIATVRTGSIVAWVNEDNRDHSVTSPAGFWDSGRLGPGQSFHLRFDEPGEFSFISIYDQKLIGAIFVTDAESTANEPVDLEPDIPDLTAEDASLPFETLRFTNVPEWPSLEAMEQAFVEIREAKILDAWGSLRTIPWNFIQDGCSPRAALAAAHLEILGLKRPSKVFVFGDLALTRDGMFASWWYHVGLAVNVQGTLYILDPAVEPFRPLELQAWLSRITRVTLQDLSVSICNSYTYAPTSLCYLSSPAEEAGAPQEALLYLDG